MPFEQLDIPGREDDWVEVVWMTDGLPLFLADREDICDVVEGMGFSIYYLFGNNLNSVTTTVKNGPTSTTKTTTATNAQMFKVVNNFIGRTVSKCDEQLPNDFVQIKEQALYTMPAIPWKLVEKLDEFFRLVDAQHSTESIVLLTYDTSKEGPDGWGVLVPDQSNTSVHCNYDPTSVVEHKPDTALIVGSVHSHPGMAAYASGTDHNDQADFDGIHITFGWQKSVNNNATQFHIEMQMAGSAYTLQPEDVFEQIVHQREPDPEVVEWSAKVKKALPPQRSTAAGVTAGQQPAVSSQKNQPTTTPTSVPLTTPVGTREYSNVNKTARFEDFPEVWKALGKNSIVVGEVVPNNLGTYDCPSCGYDMVLDDVDDGYCNWCTIPVIRRESAETRQLDDILSDIAYWCYLFNYSRDAQVYMWITSGGTENTLMPLTQGTLAEALTETSRPVASGSSTYYEDVQQYYGQATVKEILPDTFLCCGADVNRSDLCQCEIRLHPDDSIDFDNFLKSVNLYEPEAICSGCEYYYDARCPGYAMNLAQFVFDPSMPAETYANSIDGEECTVYMPYSFGYKYTETTYSLNERD